MPDLVPKEAVDFIKKKGLQEGFSYEDVWREEHSRAFTVAKCMNIDLLKDIQDSIAKAIEEGIPYSQWSKDMEKTMIDYGWWGVQLMEDPKTGEIKEVQLGSPRRLDTIFNVNMRQAYNVGVYRQAMESKAHPYLMYRIGNSKHHRKEHVAWDGLVLPKDDPWWNAHMPPNGWGCKCYVRAVSKARYERLKKKGIPDETTREYGKDLQYKPIKTRAPMDIPKTYTNKRRGLVFQGIAGIDPGFEYNPANPVDLSDAIAATYQQKSNDLTKAANGDTKPTASSLKTPVSDAFSAIPSRWKSVSKTTFDAISSVHGDGALHKIPIKTTSAGYYGQFTCYRDHPEKISMSTHAEGNHPEFTLAHEIGHFLDNDAFPKEPGKYYASDGSPSAKVKSLMDALNSSDAIRWFRDVCKARNKSYYMRPTEMVARSYAQYIAVKSGDKTMLKQLDGILGSSLDYYQHTQWTEADFRPIMKAYDDLFEELGWLEKRKN